MAMHYEKIILHHAKMAVHREKIIPQHAKMAMHREKIVLYHAELTVHHAVITLHRVRALLRLHASARYYAATNNLQDSMIKIEELR